MLVRENICNLERLAVGHIDVKKAKSRFRLTPFSQRQPTFRSRRSGYDLDDHHLQVHGDPRFVFDTRICNIFIERSLCDRWISTHSLTRADKEGFSR